MEDGQNYARKVKENCLGHLAPELILKLYKASGSGGIDMSWVRANLATQNSDMWAVGCILFTLLAGYHPFEEDQMISVMLRIFRTCATPALDSEQSDYPTLFQLCPELLSLVGQFPQWYDSM